jgi:hypothetical protein
VSSAFRSYLDVKLIFLSFHSKLPQPSSWTFFICHMVGLDSLVNAPSVGSGPETGSETTCSRSRAKPNGGAKIIERPWFGFESFRSVSQSGSGCRWMIYDIEFCVPDRHIASTILGIYLQFLTLQKSMTLETGRQVDMHQRKSDTHTLDWVCCGGTVDRPCPRLEDSWVIASLMSKNSACWVCGLAQLPYMTGDFLTHNWTQKHCERRIFDMSNHVRTYWQVHIYGQWMLPSLMHSFVGQSNIRELCPPAFQKLTVELLVPVCYSRIHTHRHQYP